MRRHQHGHAFGAQTLKELGKLIRRLGIQTGRWLVQKQRLGLFGDGDHNADLLSHALALARDSSPDGFLGQPGLDQEAAQLVFRVLFVTGERGEVLKVLEPSQATI